MKAKIFSFSLMLVMLAGLMLQGCIKDRCNTTYKYTKYTPVYMDYDAFRSAVAVEGPRDLTNPGKIYTKDDYLYVNEVGEGIHVINNTNPEAPVNVAFIVIPGNRDMAIKGSYLYVDSSIDLLVFDITNVTSPVLTRRIENTFPQVLTYRGFSADPAIGVVIDWTGEVVSETYDDCSAGPPELWVMNEAPSTWGVGMQFSANDMSAGGATRSGGTTGTAGSMARFATTETHLYVVTEASLKVYDLADCLNPALVNEVQVSAGWGETILETIYPSNNLLFIGSQTGMFIYNIATPQFPTFVSMFSHVTACDPVVADENYAYVTLRSDNQVGPCPGFTNQLDVIDISDLGNPWLTRSYPMTSPQGLGLDRNTLFVCDGSAGLRVLDATNPEDLETINTYGDMDAYDIIPLGEIAIMVGQDGISQYNYADVNNIRLLSTIPVVK